MDPPQHEHWRVLFNQAVTPHSVEMLEPVVREDITWHIDAFIARGQADIVADVAEAVPADTICRLAGIDAEMVPTIRDLAIEMFAAMGEPEEFGRRQALFGEATVGEVRRRQREPRDDYLTYLANVEVEGRQLDDDDYVVLLAAFLGAGHHSTTSRSRYAALSGRVCKSFWGRQAAWWWLVRFSWASIRWSRFLS